MQPVDTAGTVINVYERPSRLPACMQAACRQERWKQLAYNNVTKQVSYINRNLQGPTDRWPVTGQITLLKANTHQTVSACDLSVLYSVLFCIYPNSHIFLQKYLLCFFC